MGLPFQCVCCDWQPLKQSLAPCRDFLDKKA